MSPDPERPRFQHQQLAFTAHVRDPDRVPVPDDIPPRRMAVYVELLFNNLSEQLAANFPVVRRLTDDARWRAMVRDFMVRHRCETPLFTEVGLEFLDYLQHQRAADPADPPWLLELAHYEYVELAVAIDPAEDALSDVDPNGDLLAGRPVVAATAWNLGYRWPVHRIGPDHRPTEPPESPTHLVVYRDRRDAVHFLEINAVTQRLLTLLKENPEMTGLDVLKTIAEELGHRQPDSVIEAGAALLDDLRQRNVILGTRP